MLRGFFFGELWKSLNSFCMNSLSTVMGFCFGRLIEEETRSKANELAGQQDMATKR
jgi:hypothetical protein